MVVWGFNMSSTSAQLPNILIVDDRKENLLVTEKVLNNLPAKLFIAASGNDALSMMLRNKFVLIAISCMVLWSTEDCFGQFQSPEIKPPKIPTIKPPTIPEVKPPKVPPIKTPDLTKLDPVATAKRELERASNAAIHDLKKLDPQTVLSDSKTSVSQNLQREMQDRRGAMFGPVANGPRKAKAMVSWFGQWS